MAHSLIVGMTESGKTTLAKMVCARLHAKKIPTAVLDPLRDPEWKCEKQFKNPDEFLAFARNNKSYVLFVDEGGESVGRYNEEMQWLATQSRHWGHSCFFISQGVVQLAPIVRQQCSTFYVFACGHRNTDLIAEECREPFLRELSYIEKGEFFVVSRFDELQKGKINFPESGRTPLDKLTICYNTLAADREGTTEGASHAVENDSASVPAADSDTNSV